MCSPPIQGPCYYSCLHPISKGHSQQSEACERKTQGHFHFVGVRVFAGAFPFQWREPGRSQHSFCNPLPQIGPHLNPTIIN